MPDLFSDPPTLASQRKNGIFYVTDASFALPTIAGALELRRKTTPECADIRIIVTGMPDDGIRRLRDHLAPHHIDVDVLPPQLFTNFDQRLFNKTHVPMATLGRFFMLDCVPDIYDRILYLDGDTWPVGDPAALFKTKLPEGRFAAAEDQSYFYRHDRGRTGALVRAYFAGLGIDGDQGYFNAGVLLASAATWRTLSGEAFQFFRQSPGRCKYHDQSALNAVAGNRRLRLGTRWNFISMYTQWGLKTINAPQILHFCGDMKPWLLPAEPFFENYVEAFSRLSDLDLAVAPYSKRQIAEASNSMRRQKLKLATIFRHRKIRRQCMLEWLDEHAQVL